MIDTHISENEQMRRAVANESNTMPSLQISYNHDDVSIHDPTMLNLSLPSPLTDDSTNMLNSLSVRLTFIFIKYFNNLLCT